jgi:nitrite reductase/ring-hydroxylating ferredoxin subunit
VSDDFEALAPAADLPAGALLGVTTSRGELVCLVNDGGVIRALAGRCAHRGYLLAEGTLLPGGRLECLWHGAQYDVRTGAPVHPPAEEPIAVYEVAVRDGMVCVRMGVS